MANVSPTLSRILLNKVIATNEVGSLNEAFVLSHAGTANSGFSVGVFQLDLAHQAGARATVEAFLAQTGMFNTANLDAIGQAFVTRGNPDAIGANLKTRIDDAFSSPDGRAMIDGLDVAQLNALMGFIGQACGDAQANPRYASDPAFQAFCDSNLFQALIGDNANQFGPPNTLGRYIAGQAVTVGGDTLQMGDATWDFQGFAAYEAHYKYVTASEQGAADLRRRRTNVINVLAANQALGDIDPADCLAIIQTTYQATG